ncbi:MAG TPA: hypothetical protein VIL97_02465 [Thermoanaerobaculia bacterium]
MKRMSRGTLWLGGWIALQIGVPAPILSQAWIAPKGETSVSLTFQQSDFPGHLTDSGDELAILDSDSRTALFEIDYSVSDRFALSVGIPSVATRNGRDESPVAGRSGVDDGQWHSTLQDWRLSARYNVLADPVVLTPFIRVVIPSHDYQTRAEAAPGRNLHEVIAGFEAGRLLSSLPSAYVHGRLSYAFVEELAGISTDRVNGDLSMGYFVTPALSLSVSGGFQNTNGGLRDTYLFDADGFKNPDVPDELFFEHDRLLADDHVRAGVGASYALGRSWSLSAGYATIVSGSNSHYGESYLLGLQWTVRPGW